MPTGPLLVKFGGMSKVSEISFIFNNDDELQVGSCAICDISIESDNLVLIIIWKTWLSGCFLSK